MTKRASFDLIRDLLDHELIDCEGVSCGMVDDVELEHHANGLVVTALLSGGRVWARRLPALCRVLMHSVGWGRRTRIAFAQVTEISEVIRLDSRAAELGLGIADRSAGRMLARIAGGS